MKYLIHKYLFYFFFIFFIIPTNISHSNIESKISLPQYLKIEIPNSKLKSYLKNQINAELDGDTKEKKNIRRKYKKWWSVSISYSNNNKKITLPAKVRIMGDYKDHLNLPHTSLKVRIKQGTIGGIKQFRLLLPKTRHAEREIFFTILLRHIGFAAPETRFINVQTNFGKYKALFQEDATKEFLERNNFVETPVIKQNEHFFEPSEKTSEYLSNLKVSPVMKSYIVDNKNFLKKKNAIIAVSNAIALSHNYDHLINDRNKSFFFENEDVFTKILGKYANHGLQWHNRRFIYNPIMQSFSPLYYDGMVEFPTIELIKSGVCNQNNYKQFISLISKEYKLKSKKALSFIQKCTINDIFNISLKYKKNKKNLKKNIFKEKKIYDQNWKRIRDQIINHINSGNSINKKSESGPRFTLYYKKQFYICYYAINYQFINYCKNLKLKKYKKYISNNTKLKIFNGIEFPTINLGNLDFNSFTKENFKEINFDNNFQNKIILNLNQPINYFLTKKIDKKDLHVNFLNSKSRLVFLSEIVNSKIKFNFNKDLTFKSLLVDKTNNIMLTGCATFYMSRIENTHIEGSNGFCEDAVNFINVNGNNITISLNNSSTDAFDADFSDLKIKNIEINLAGNDCADFSFGKYKLSSAILSNCSDKAFSFGETSQGTIKNAKIQNALTALAVKDDANISIENSLANNVRDCISIYNKKEEFGSGTANITKYKCNGIYNKDKAGLLNFK